VQHHLNVAWLHIVTWNILLYAYFYLIVKREYGELDVRAFSFSLYFLIFVAMAFHGCCWYCSLWWRHASMCGWTQVGNMNVEMNLKQTNLQRAHSGNNANCMGLYTWNCILLQFARNDSDSYDEVLVDREKTFIICRFIFSTFVYVIAWRWVSL
jgi:hypothetical protein